MKYESILEKDFAWCKILNFKESPIRNKYVRSNYKSVLSKALKFWYEKISVR